MRSVSAYTALQCACDILGMLSTIIRRVSVYTFCRLSVNMSKEDFILVPRSVNDITTEWCNEVLHCGKCISSEIYVSQVEVENLTHGEGLSGAQMVRLQLTYRYLFSNIFL